MNMSYSHMNHGATHMSLSKDRFWVVKASDILDGHSSKLDSPSGVISIEGYCFKEDLSEVAQEVIPSAAPHRETERRRKTSGPSTVHKAGASISCLHQLNDRKRSSRTRRYVHTFHILHGRPGVTSLSVRGVSRL